jgi:hypothetical protein
MNNLELFFQTFLQAHEERGNTYSLLKKRFKPEVIGSSDLRDLYFQLSDLKETIDAYQLEESDEDEEL